MIEQAKFTYSPLEKAFQKQTKRIEKHGSKQVETFKSLQLLNIELLSIKHFI